jgi:hypothetical protein
MRGTRVAAAIAWIVGYVLLLGALVLVLGNGDLDAKGAAAILLATISFGYAIRRWWALGLPAGLVAIGLLVDYLKDPSCGKCGEDDSWAVLVFLAVLVGVLPLTLAMLVGVTLGKLAARRRAARPGRA